MCNAKHAISMHCYHIDALCHEQAKNALVSHAKLVQALVSMHSKSPCLFPDDGGAAALVSVTLRTLLSKYRDLKNPKKAEVVRSKA